MAYSVTLQQSSARKLGVSPAVAKLLTALWTWRRRMADRAEIRRFMERADDRMLADIGMNRAKLADVAGRPFWRV